MGVRGRKAGNTVGNRPRSTRWYNFYLKIFTDSSKGSLVRKGVDFSKEGFDLILNIDLRKDLGQKSRNYFIH